MAPTRPDLVQRIRLHRREPQARPTPIRSPRPTITGTTNVFVLRLIAAHPFKDTCHTCATALLLGLAATALPHLPAMAEKLVRRVGSSDIEIAFADSRKHQGKTMAAPCSSPGSRASNTRAGRDRQHRLCEAQRRNKRASRQLRELSIDGFDMARGPLGPLTVDTAWTAIAAGTMGEAFRSVAWRWRPDRNALRRSVHGGGRLPGIYVLLLRALEIVRRYLLPGIPLIACPPRPPRQEKWYGGQAPAKSRSPLPTATASSATENWSRSRRSTASNMAGGEHWPNPSYAGARSSSIAGRAGCGWSGSRFSGTGHAPPAGRSFDSEWSGDRSRQFRRCLERA